MYASAKTTAAMAVTPKVILNESGTSPKAIRPGHHRLIYPDRPMTTTNHKSRYALGKSDGLRLLTCGDQASGSRQCRRSVAAHRGGDVGLVARRVGQRPP